jgi:hypothetical protein
MDFNERIQLPPTTIVFPGGVLRKNRSSLVIPNSSAPTTCICNLFSDRKLSIYKPE